MATDPWDGATTIPLLPCTDVDEMRDFWVALGFDLNYRQLRPNPVVSLRRGAVDLQYFGLEQLAPEDSCSSCVVVVSDTEPVFAALAEGLRSRYGRLPLTCFPDSHGDAQQARKILAGALRREQGADLGYRIGALAFLAGLAVRTQDPEAARATLDELAVLTASLDEPSPAVALALAQADELRADLGRP